MASKTSDYDQYPDVIFDDNQTDCINLTSCNNTPAYDYPQYDDSVLLFYFILWNVITPILFAIIILVGTVGNVLVIYVILSRVTMQTTTNYLLINLALSDLAFLLIVAPITAYKYAAASWPFGDTACKIVHYVIYVSAYVTVYTLIAVSVLRYLTVIHGVSTARYRTKRNIIVVNFFIWILLLVVNIPSLLIHQLKIFDEHFSYCGLAADSTKAFYLTFFLFGYGIPLVIICVLYLVIVDHLHKASSSAVGQTRRRTTRVSKVILLVVLVFAVLWLPLHVNQLLSVFGTVPAGHWYEVIRVLCNCFAYGNSCANPIIYNFVSKDFKNGFRAAVCCRPIAGRRGRNGTTTNTDNGLATERSTMM
ncbi:hypothetical protein LSH36_470g00003 [Paralvinella palmiformis]|uniref:G-protein coupled receptors family 1 profile domain-containing protein n=1 Tax=Paralvinella palmiformis TaxID=53620 RepID=A0AAD9JAA9_9ANNE|nr:hypothetical protein LSH36_470g00003 [Paralvinella palmiformis]